MRANVLHRYPGLIRRVIQEIALVLLKRMDGTISSLDLKGNSRVEAPTLVEHCILPP